uniref:hypothetical protein n=1 Tax=Sphingomonas sp. TaxID=28214 RepID=UPI002DD64B43
RKDATHWTDAETGQRVPAELAAKLEKRWQASSDTSIKTDSTGLLKTDALYRTDTPLTDRSTPNNDASLSERAARAVAGDKLTPEQRKAVIKEIAAVYPDFVGNDKSDVYLVARLEAMRANENKIARSGAPTDEGDAAEAKRIAENADSDPRADSRRQ